MADPENFYCRLTHGVVMFKLGLMTQARTDFALAAEQHPREAFGLYNHALTLL